MAKNLNKNQTDRALSSNGKLMRTRVVRKVKCHFPFRSVSEHRFVNLNEFHSNLITLDNNEKELMSNKVFLNEQVRNTLLIFCIFFIF